MTDVVIDNNKPQPFIDYWDAVDAAMVKFFGVDTMETAIEADEIAAAQDAGDKPEDFALSWGKLYGLRLSPQPRDQP